MAIYGGQVQTTPYQAPDYGPSVATARDLAMTQAQGIAGMVGQVGDYFKQQGEKKKLIKKSDVQIDAALKLFPDLAPALQGYRDQLKDENLPLDDRMAIADSISNVINMGVGEMRNAQSNLFKKQQLEAEAEYRNRMATASETRAGASLLGAQQKAKEIKSEEVPVVNAATGEKDSVLINRDAQGRMRDPVSGKVIKDLFKYANEGEGWEAPEEPAMPPTSQVSGGAAGLIANAAQMNIGKLSTAKTPGTQGGNVGCADAICRTFKEATGEELVPGGTLSTREMATTLESDPRFVKVPITEAQKGDIVLTPRKGNKAGHTGIVLDGGAIASNSSKGFAGKAPGTFVQNYTIDSWRKNVAPRNPSETAAYRYIKAQGIDNALSMGGDMTQQAMGTPERQAEAARQIEQGQQLRLATAQNITQGAVPTEPSMATRQPQLPQQAAPQVNTRLLAARQSKTAPTMMTAEQVQNLVSQGFKVDGIPANGGFMVSGVTAGGGDKTKKVEIVTGPKAQALDLDPRGTYEISRDGDNITGVQTITSAPTAAEVSKVEESKAELEKAKAAKDISIKTISEFVDKEGRPTEALQSAVGYGEALATGIAEYAPIIGTQSGKTRSDQQRLARLVEGSVLEAASLLKPVSNTDLKMLIQNRPQITDPVETWTGYFREIRSILKNPNNYLDAAEPEKPQTATQKLRGKLQGQ